MNKLDKLLAIILLAVPLPLTAENPSLLFEQANEYYSKGDYKLAIKVYREALDIAQSAPLNYNLGNVYFKIGEIGLAVLHYERSLAIDPLNPEVRANLAFVRESAELQEPSYGPLTQFSMLLPLEYWCWSLSIGFWVTISLVVFPRLYGGGNLITRFFLLLSVFATSTCLLALIGTHKKGKGGIILTTNTLLRVAPSKGSPEAGYLQSGEVASIKKIHQDFVFVELEAGKSGWIKESEIGRIWE
ncbi:MAG: hypothetical protein DF168_01056 [Candidatus Moanabacter tarae]|uniref:Tetratricopeptide repeat protein n=1 Tax=Candidatus Moanibacter tarae TaxID=2200854 RepID=A0A2Z4ACJ5_9BACT|nr:MAG: hypothetical protein DF168_01056 [Candidatus Moanabacter tarae]|tara:strand:+ start:5771 stop:6502 length:732 start_codon:yes stop_codon:yes gene_type:complete